MTNLKLSRFLGYVKLNDSVKESAEAYSILEKLNLATSIEQPVMICKKFYSSDSVTIEYYSNHTVLLTSLICSTLDRSSGQCLKKYFSKFLEFYSLQLPNSGNQIFLSEIEELNDRIASSTVDDLDNILKSYQPLLKTLSNFLREHFVNTFIQVLDVTSENLEDLVIDNPLFVNRITVSLSTIKSPVNVVIGSRFCNRLFPIKQSRLSDELLDDVSYEKYRKLSATYKNLDFALNRYLYNTRNSNGIIYSYLLMDSVQSLLVELVSSKDGE